MMKEEAHLAIKVLRKMDKNYKRRKHVSKKGEKIGISVDEEKMAQLIKKLRRLEKSGSKLNQNEKNIVMKHIAQRLLKSNENENDGDSTTYLADIIPILADAMKEDKKTLTKKNDTRLLLNDPQSQAEFMIANNPRLQSALRNKGRDFEASDVITILPQLINIIKDVNDDPDLFTSHLSNQKRVERWTYRINLIITQILNMININEQTRHIIEKQLEQWLPSAIKIIIRVEDYITGNEILKVLKCPGICHNIEK